MNWHISYTILLVIIAAALTLEIYAATTQLRKDMNRWPTISEAVWRLTERHPWVKWAGTVFFILLILHFWWGLWRY